MELSYYIVEVLKGEDMERYVLNYHNISVDSYNIVTSFN